MANTFKTLVVSFLNASIKLETLAAEMRDQFADPTDRKFIRSECLPYVVAFYGVTMIEKERGSGVTFPDTAEGKTAANKLSLMVNAIVGKTAAHTPTPVKVTRAQASAAKEFLALFPSKAAALAAIKAVKV